MAERIDAAISSGLSAFGYRARAGRRTRPLTAAAWRAAYDAAAFLLALTVARYVAALLPSGPHPQTGFVLAPAPPYYQIALLGGCLLAYLAAQGHFHRRLPFWCELRQLLAAAGFALLLNGTMEYLFDADTPRTVVVGTWVLFPLVALPLRWLTIRLLDGAGLWRRSVIVVGEEGAAQLAAQAIRAERRLGYDVAAVVDPSTVAGEPYAAWRRLLRRYDAAMVVLAPGGLGSPGAGFFDHADIDGLRRHGIPASEIVPTRTLPVSGRAAIPFAGHDFALVDRGNAPFLALSRAAKVGFDVTAAALLLVFLAPVMLAIAVAVKRDGGKAFYAHMRIGAGGQRFACLKFRSMVQDSEAVLKTLLSSDPAAAMEWAATQKLRDDPRVTRIGRVLRKTSLDELPQLLNVLRLEMSLVGPRPIVDDEVVHYGDSIVHYHGVRPGLTGLWQVGGRSDTTYAHRVQLDSWYVRNWSLWQDVAILARTVPAVLKRRGAV